MRFHPSTLLANRWAGWRCASSATAMTSRTRVSRGPPGEGPHTKHWWAVCPAVVLELCASPAAEISWGVSLDAAAAPASCLRRVAGGAAGVVCLFCHRHDVADRGE